MEITTILLLYLALLVVLFFHEFAYSPRHVRLEMKYYLIPNFYAFRAKNRIGGIMMLVAIISGIALWNPTIAFFQYIGIMAWIYFLVLMIFSVFNEDKRAHRWHRSRKVLDPVPNKHSGWYLLGTIIVFAFTYSYYWQLIGGLF